MSGLLHLVEAATALTQLAPSSSSLPSSASSSSAEPSPSTSPVPDPSFPSASSIPRRLSTHAISDDDDSSANLAASAKMAALRENHLQALRAAASAAASNQQQLHRLAPAAASYPQLVTNASRRLSGGSESSASSSKDIFPMRLHALLADRDPAARDAVSWLPHGKSFVVLRPDVFAAVVLPRYFAPEGSNSVSSSSSSSSKASSKGVHKYPSFTRKLNRWGFRQISRGPDAGAFCHELFQRDDPAMCRGMVCQKSRKATPGGASSKSRAHKIGSSSSSSSLPDDLASVSSASTMGTRSVASYERRAYSSTVTVSTAGAASRKSLPFKKRKAAAAANETWGDIPSTISHRSSTAAEHDAAPACPSAAASQAPADAEAAARAALARHFHEQHRAFALASLMENSRLAMEAIGMGKDQQQASSVACPPPPRAQQPSSSPVIGAITTHSPSVYAATVAAPPQASAGASGLVAASAQQAARSALYGAYLQALAGGSASSASS